MTKIGDSLPPLGWQDVSVFVVGLAGAMTLGRARQGDTLRSAVSSCQNAWKYAAGGLVFEPPRLLQTTPVELRGRPAAHGHRSTVVSR